MPTQITQHRDEHRRSTVLKIEGDLLHDDAVLIRSLVVDLLENQDENVVIDLADLDFLDSEGAHILSNLSALNRVAVDGAEIFLQTAVTDVERRAGSSRPDF